MTDNAFRLRLDSGVKRATAVTLVHDVLHSAILRGDLPGNSRLVQTEIAQQLGVSTTPVREAMRDLATAGFIVMESYKIGIVCQPGWEEMEEIVGIRRALEPMALDLAMKHADDAFLDEAEARAVELRDISDVGTWVQMNSAFHSMFHRRTHTKRLVGLLEGLENAGGLFVAQAQRLQPEIRDRAVADHFDLIEAFRNRDLARAIEIQHEHLSLPLLASKAN